MILFVSGRCDIPAFFSEWFMNRIEAGFVDVRNPYYEKQVSRIYFEDVDAFVFCTKNPIPLLPFLHQIEKPILFHITLTAYHHDVEVNVIDKKKIIESIKQLSSLISQEFIYVRYDPIFVNEKYTVEYHIKAFERLCECLDGFVKHIIISFLDDYKNVRHHQKDLKVKELQENDIERIGKAFGESARKHGMSVQTCAEELNLTEYGFIQSDCMSKEIMFNLTGKMFKKGNIRGNQCGCVKTADIGVYNSCPHRCRYCYANYEEKRIQWNMKNHDKNSSLLIGHLKEDDVIKVRKK